MERHKPLKVPGKALVERSGKASGKINEKEDALGRKKEEGKGDRVWVMKSSFRRKPSSKGNVEGEKTGGGEKVVH